jgi:hypothetical protein
VNDDLHPVWDGRVTDLDGDVFTVELVRKGHPTVYADYNLHECPDVVPGDLVTVTPWTITRKSFGRWSRWDLWRARRTGRRLARRFQRLVR